MKYIIGVIEETVEVTETDDGVELETSYEVEVEEAPYGA